MTRNLLFRSHIRQTWGSKVNLEALNASLFFFVGRSTNLRVEYDMKHENEVFGDLIQTGVTVL